MATATATKHSLLMYPTKRRTVGLYVESREAYKYLMTVLKPFIRAEKLPVRAQFYDYPARWVVYINTKGISASLRNMLESNFSIDREDSAKSHRAKIAQRIEHGNHVSTLRSRLMQVSNDLLLSAAIQFYGSESALHQLAQRHNFKVTSWTNLLIVSIASYDISDLEGIYAIVEPHLDNDVTAIVTYCGDDCDDVVEGEIVDDDVDFFGPFLLELVECTATRITALLPGAGHTVGTAPDRDKIMAQTKAKLRAYAKRHGLTRYSHLNKTDLVNLITPVLLKLRDDFGL